MTGNEQLHEVLMLEFGRGEYENGSPFLNGLL